MIFNALLVIVGNLWYELIVFGNTVLGSISNLDPTLATNNFIIDTYTSLTGLSFPFMYSLGDFPLPSLTIGIDTTNIFEYYNSLIRYSSYGIVALVLQVALSLGAIYFAIKFASKVARMIKDLINPLN